MSKRYSEDFKKQLVSIYNQGNSSYKKLSDEYGISTATIHSWVIRYNSTKSFSIDDNRTEEEKRIIEMEKELKQLRMENDILYPEGHANQAALLLGKK